MEFECTARVVVVVVGLIVAIACYNVYLKGKNLHGLGKETWDWLEWDSMDLAGQITTSYSATILWLLSQLPGKCSNFFFPCILLSSPHEPVRRDSSTLFASLWSFCYSWLLPLRVPFYFQTRYQVRETLLVSMWCSYPIQHCGIYWCVIEQNASM